MQIVFGSGVAIGRFAMGSNEPFGELVDLSTPETQFDMTRQEELEFIDPFKTPDSQKTMDSNKSNQSSKGVPTNLGKRKHVAKEDPELMIGLTTIVNNVVENLIQPIKDDRAMYGELYQVVMGVLGFMDEALMYVLSHMRNNKSQGFGFLEMTNPYRLLWLRTFLGKHYY
jgi:hypothetical protein